MNLDLAIGDLAQGNIHRSRDDLGLSIAQCGDDGRLNNAGGNELSVSYGRNSTFLSTAGNSNDGDGLTLLGPVTIVQVVEVTRKTLVESCRFTQGQDVVIAEREATCVKGTSLGRTVELELEVGRNISSSVLCVKDRSVRQTNNEDAILPALSTFLEVYIPFLLGLGDSDLKDSIKATGASCWSTAGRGHLVSDTLWCCKGSAEEGRSQSEGGSHLGYCCW